MCISNGKSGSSLKSSVEVNLHTEHVWLWLCKIHGKNDCLCACMQVLHSMTFHLSAHRLHSPQLPELLLAVRRVLGAQPPAGSAGLPQCLCAQQPHISWPRKSAISHSNTLALCLKAESITSRAVSRIMAWLASVLPPLTSLLSVLEGTGPLRQP